MSGDFYIGWESKAAPAIGRSTRRVAVLFLTVAAILPLALAFCQRMIGVSVFEWGVRKEFTGILQLSPYPHLLVERPGQSKDVSRVSSYHLVAPWKFGLPSAQLAALAGKAVSLKGTLIYRDNQTMIETRPEWIAISTNIPSSSTPPPIVPLGRVTLVGEIVDSKCFLGVMNPGQSTPHRACAIRCISGGCPPLLAVRQTNGPPIYLLLVSSEGKPVNDQVLDFVAEPVEITGEVERQGEILILRADTAACRRVRTENRQ